MIPDEVVEQVAQAADIVAIIGEHVRLKKMGSVYRGPCPFHQGTNNNFSVMPKGGYTCFVCGEKGSVFTFVEKRLGLSFPEAVKYVGEKSGVEVREVRREREGPDPREPLWELNATAAAWFSEMLWTSDAGQPAREYLVRRGLADTTARRFGLGFAPREIGLMRAYLNGLGFSDERLLSLGLLVRREEQDEPRPRFRDRLMFPILDASGRTVGFGGRLLVAGEPKYLNSAESEVFSKGRLLYNLSNARSAIRREERIILVEGYFDVVRLVEAGVEAVVAPMGTALADAQADLIAKYARTVFLLYDSDGPGQKASFRAGDALLERGMSVRVVTLMEGEDPDTFVAKHGREALEKLLGESMDVFDRKVQLLDRAGWFADLQRKRRALDALLPTIRSTSDPITRDLYLARASAAAGVERSVLAHELTSAPIGGARSANRRTTPPPQAAPPPAGRGPGQGEQRGRHEAPYRSDVPAGAGELALVRVMLLYPELADRVVESVERLEEEEGANISDIAALTGAERGVLRDGVYRAIYDAVVLHGADAPADVLAESLDGTAIGVLETIKAEPGAVVDAARTMGDAVRRLKARGMEERLGEFDRMTPLASGDEKDALLREKDVLRRELSALGGRGWKSVRRSVK
ncbi:MAG TPA: DNA primase [Gemmatimonadaceae bacterium]|nr:DNA primase [Gemmatimonadaceae bacterium]